MYIATICLAQDQTKHVVQVCIAIVCFSQHHNKNTSCPLATLQYMQFCSTAMWSPSLAAVQTFLQASHDATLLLLSLCLPCRPFAETFLINLRCRSYISLKDLRQTRNSVHLTLYSVSSITWHKTDLKALHQTSDYNRQLWDLSKPLVQLKLRTDLEG